METPTIELRDTLIERLLAWYGRHRRDLPWRRTGDPYRIWVAEVMLQQTQVETVVPYYERFVARFPTVARLAAAPLDDVLKAWEGLGYYARARNLHAAAKLMVQRHRGQVPDSWADLIGLPGIGRYTAAAVLSIAYGQAYPALDGNVRRVLCRVFNVAEPPSEGKTQRRLWDLARGLIPSGGAGDFNQALMDLGAMVCVPKAPRCSACPLSELCQARRLGLQEVLPVPSPRKARPHLDVTAGVVWKGHRFLIAQRNPDGLLGGLWEFPGGKRERGESLRECLRREIREELGIDVEVGQPLTTINHGYSHFRMTLHAFHCRYLSGQPQALDCADWRWVTLDDLDTFAFSRADQKIVAALREHRGDAPPPPASRELGHKTSEVSAGKAG